MVCIQKRRGSIEGQRLIDDDDGNADKGKLTGQRDENENRY